ncbi:MAG TPA: BlaI/MecI/CopY family transcriptional regulator [Pseudonocardiaceae bacterium]|nr:BlaI/MecI/CopY family transcriptional regulator [Pseudonocardiaceae bacterium]
MDAAGPKRSRRAAGELEYEVLAALWAAPGPVTPREVQAALERELAYNTVQTILVRLHDKGLVRRTSEDRAHRYSPTKEPAELTAERMHVLLTSGEDRRTVLHRFVGTLDPTDEKLLRDVLEQAHKPPTE